MYLNKVELIGFLGGDPSKSATAAGVTRTTMSLATTTSWEKEGERKERTIWHDIVAWAALGDYAADFRKGAHLRVEGEIRPREYEHEGKTVKTYEIVAASILNLRPGQRKSEASTVA